MRIARRSALGFLFVLLFCPGALASGGIRAVSGDESFASMEYDTALARYEVALQSDSGRADILWRLARLYLCLGDITPDSSREAYYRKAEQFARLTIAADSTVAEGHTWLAASLGSMAMEGGAKRKVRLAREIKRELDAAIGLNTNDDVARSLLGSFYRALGNISWIERSLANIFLGGLPSGGFEDAERELLAAIRIAPNEFRHHYELGRLYADWDRPGEAVKAFTRAIDVGPRMAADRQRMVQARIRIAELTAD